jgi:hypothetical protein
VKYQDPSTYHLKVIAKVNVFNKRVKHQGQGHKVKNVTVQFILRKRRCAKGNQTTM